MAAFAKIGLNSKVIAVHSVNDKDCQDANGVENEEVGIQFLERVHNYPFWKQTSYNTRGGQHASGDNSKALRGNHAGIGMTYDDDNDIFIHSKPYASWVLNTTDAVWHSPIGDPPSLTEQECLKYAYQWNEDNQSWDKIDLQPSLVL